MPIQPHRPQTVANSTQIPELDKALFRAYGQNRAIRAECGRGRLESSVGRQLKEVPSRLGVCQHDSVVRDTRGDDPEPGHLVMLTPQGRPLDQVEVERLAGQKRILLLCGRYEGFDERIRRILEPDELSIGDFVLNGGEVAAMAVIDAVMRLVPGVLGDEDSSRDESFSGRRRFLQFKVRIRNRVQRLLRSPVVIIHYIVLTDPIDMLLAEKHKMIQRFYSKC